MKRGDMFSRVMEEYGSEEVNMNEGRVADKKADDVVALAEVRRVPRSSCRMNNALRVLFPGLCTPTTLLTPRVG